MIVYSIILIVIEAVFATCLWISSQMPAFWLLPLAASPLLLLAFWKKPTLACSQRIFSVVFALALGALTVFCGRNAMSTVAFYNVDASIFFAAYFGTVSVLATITGLLISLATKQHYRAFVLSVLFGIASDCVPQTNFVLCTVTFGLITLSACCLFVAIFALNRRIDVASKIVETKNVAPQLLLRNVAFVATAVNLFFVLTISKCNKQDIIIANFAASTVCAVLEFVLLFTYLRQPLDFVAESKIQIATAKPDDVDLQLVKSQLLHRLCKEQCYPLAMTIKKLGFLLRCKTVGLEKVHETAACFVANHYEIYGPLATVLKFPRVLRPWTDSLITNKATLANQLESGIEVSTGKWLIKPIRKKLPKLISNPLWKTVNCARAISVYRHDADKKAAMFEESADALISGDCVMIYPERPPEGEHYKIGPVDKFQTGFVEIAKYYYQKTGKEMNFYPLYVDKKGRQMIVGEKITFDSTANLWDERCRIAEQIYDNMMSIYEKCNASLKR